MTLWRSTDGPLLPSGTTSRPPSQRFSKVVLLQALSKCTSFGSMGIGAWFASTLRCPLEMFYVGGRNRNPLNDMVAWELNDPHMPELDPLEKEPVTNMFFASFTVSSVNMDFPHLRRRGAPWWYILLLSLSPGLWGGGNIVKTTHWPTNVSFSAIQEEVRKKCL